MSSACVQAHSDQKAAGIVTVMRRQKSTEGWDKINISAIFYTKGFFAYALLVLHKPDRLHPLYSSPSNLDGTFKSVLCLAIKSVADCCKKPVIRQNGFVPHIRKNKASSSVGSLYLTWS